MGDSAVKYGTAKLVYVYMLESDNKKTRRAFRTSVLSFHRSVIVLEESG